MVLYCVVNFSNFNTLIYVVQNSKKKNYIYKLGSNNKILSSSIKKAWCTCTFRNHFREANEQLLDALFL